MNVRLVVISTLSAGLLAAGDASDWSRLARIKPGENIQVVQTNKISLEGEFAGFSDTAIALRTAGGEVSIEKERIVRVSTKPRGRRGRNALIGAGIAGAIAGTLAGVSASRGLDDYGAGMAVASTAVYSGIGALIGAVIPPGATVYRVAELPPAGAAGSRESGP